MSNLRLVLYIYVTNNKAISLKLLINPSKVFKYIFIFVKSVYSLLRMCWWGFRLRRSVFKPQNLNFKDWLSFNFMWRDWTQIFVTSHFLFFPNFYYIIIISSRTGPLVQSLITSFHLILLSSWYNHSYKWLTHLQWWYLDLQFNWWKIPSM